MAGAPRFKVYDAHGTYQGSCKEPEAAAAMLSGIYNETGATIRDGHTKVMWREGPTTCANCGFVGDQHPVRHDDMECVDFEPDGDGEAGESFDYVASIVWRRVSGIDSIIASTNAECGRRE